MGGKALKIFDSLRFSSLSFLTTEASAMIYYCSRDIDFHLFLLRIISNVFREEVINFSVNRLYCSSYLSHFVLIYFTNSLSEATC